MAGTTQHVPKDAWASVILMLVGFIMCTFGFVDGNNLILWIGGGVVGGIGVILAKTSKLMSQTH